jgi:transcription termination factor NusB
MQNKEYTNGELEDAIKKNEQQIKKSIRRLGAEKITCSCLKKMDLSQIPEYKTIRESVLETYADDKQPDFQKDLEEKAEKRVRGIVHKIEYLEKETNLFKEELSRKNTKLDDF